ncbi:thioesterase family protein [Halobacterium sp. CBA1126]|uniref:acyl-CoA thioesterase n=1 Tax=Halobacterium sp. CBA1126 TaxID=2668074 RepID=UPI0012FC8BA3|nr:thioesterase family protein [Halobacterium sp. CBA1126]MUV60910.1 acyl-CoA thioesterase [Halobacterium sp. CBA1126]
MTEFPFTTTVDVRYQDHDAIGHVNNAVYVTYLEEARVAYLAEYAGLSMETLSMVVAHLDVDFREPVQHADSVEVAVDVTDVGGSSFTMAYEVRHQGSVAVEAESVQVTVDADTGESHPVPKAWRQAFDDA